MKKIFTILFLFICYVANSQNVYKPNIAGVTMNKPAGIAQAVPTDARSYYYDTANFIWRAYTDTGEVKRYLNLPKYRTGQFDIVVNTGGSLSGGVITGGINTIWYFKNGQADSNLVIKIPQSLTQIYAKAPAHILGTDTVTVDTSILATKYYVNNVGFLTNITGLVTAGANVTVTGSGTTISPYVINSSGGGGGLSSVGLTMPTAFTVSNSPLVANGTIAVTGAGTTGQYIRGDGSLGTTPALFNPIAGLGILLTGTYPNITFAIDTTQRLDTVFGKYPLYVPNGTPDTLAIYPVGLHQNGALDSGNFLYFTNKQQPIQWNDGTNNLETPGFYTTYKLGVNMTADTVGNVITLKANAPTAFQAKQTYLNSANTPFAAAGVITVIKFDSGFVGTFHSTDTLDLKLQKDTIFIAYKGSPGDSIMWTGGSVDTIYSPRFRDSLGFFHVFNPDGSLTFGTSAILGADQGLRQVNGDTVQLGGSFYKNDTIQAKGFSFIMDTLNFMQQRAVNLGTDITSKVSLFTFSTVLQTSANTAGNGDSSATIETVRAGTNYKAFVQAGTGTNPFFPLFQAQTSDSSALIQGPHIKFSSDTTLGGDGMFITELPYITDSTNQRQIVWNNSTGKLSAMTVGTGGSTARGSFVVATAPNTANYTITTANFVILSDLTGQANRDLVLPSAPASGQELLVKNINTPASTFNWAFTNGTVKDFGQNTITTVSTLTVFDLIWDGSFWDITQ